MSFSSWPQVLTHLLVDRTLTTEQAQWAMRQMMAGDATSAQVAAFVTALRAKGETAGDISALVDVMLEHALSANVAGLTVDTCGTGGDGAHTVNISTMAAVVVAASGLTVVKHGNRAASSKCGSADVLEALGVRLDLPAEAVSEVAHIAGITFYFAQAFHPALRHVGPARREIGIPTVFNVLGPLANPARPTAQVLGVANEKLAPVMAEVLHRRGTKALVVRGNEGLDELSTHGVSTIWNVLGSEVTVSEFDPASLDIAQPAADALAGGDAQFNATVMSDLFEGVSTPKLDAVRDAVCLNAAAALVAAEAVNVDVTNINEALTRNFAKAKELIESGAAKSKLELWIKTTQGIA
ncbi:MAG: anthranilate phosphoribosyltransferase [Actinomycetota bacterium]|jgi:anthranilate phosphoribosyltransferase